MKSDLEDIKSFSQTLIRQSSQQTQPVVLATEHENFSIFTSIFQSLYLTGQFEEPPRVCLYWT